MKPSIRRRALLFGAGFVAFLFTGLAWAQEVSHARVVRLSFTEGTVAVQRPDAQGWASAPVNTPIQEGFQLSTEDNSFAEVEFENSSTARIGQNSLLEFPQLALDSDGGKLNHLLLAQGYATFNFFPGQDDQDKVEAGDATITVISKKTTRFRADLDQDAIRVEVFMGQVDVSGTFGSRILEANSIFVLRPNSESPVEISRGITEDDWDQWVDQREQQIEEARNRPAPGIYSPNVSSLYGWSDLYNYGNWVYIPSYGYGWRPSVAAGWTPYSYGRWGWYPGFGYTWISFEPWGWLPFHYGGWILQPGFGWCWVPGSLNLWSPALVTWYQGPGWVGWAPYSQYGTCGGTNCMTVVSNQTFQNGEPVHRRLMKGVRFEQGVHIAKPQIQPARAGMLTGSPLPARSVTRFGVRTRETGPAVNQAKSPASAAPRSGNAPSARAPGREFGPRPERPAGVVFDSKEGRYVNNPNAPAAPAEKREAPASAGERETQAPAAVRPIAPRVTAPAATDGGGNFERDRAPSPRTGIVRREQSDSPAPASGNKNGSYRPAMGRSEGSAARPAPPSNRSSGAASRPSNPSPNRGASIQRSAPRSESVSAPRASSPRPSGNSGGARVESRSSEGKPHR